MNIQSCLAIQAHTMRPNIRGCQKKEVNVLQWERGQIHTVLLVRGMARLGIMPD